MDEELGKPHTLLHRNALAVEDVQHSLLDGLSRRSLHAFHDLYYQSAVEYYGRPLTPNQFGLALLDACFSPAAQLSPDGRVVTDWWASVLGATPITIYQVPSAPAPQLTEEG